MDRNAGCIKNIQAEIDRLKGERSRLMEERKEAIERIKELYQYEIDLINDRLKDLTREYLAYTVPPKSAGYPRIQDNAPEV